MLSYKNTHTLGEEKKLIFFFNDNVCSGSFCHQSVFLVCQSAKNKSILASAWNFFPQLHKSIYMYLCLYIITCCCK